MQCRKLNTANLQLQYRNVVAPVTGVIFDPQASQESVINSGQRILSIVPQEGLYAEVYVPNKDIGFVKMKQEAKVRVDAFPFSRYGNSCGNTPDWSRCFTSDGIIHFTVFRLNYA